MNKKVWSVYMVGQFSGLMKTEDRLSREMDKPGDSYTKGIKSASRGHLQGIFSHLWFLDFIDFI